MRPARLAVVLVAHGSRDPRAAQATEALTRAVRERHPLWDVRASYLDHSVPRPRQVLADFAARGHRSAVLVPLLLTAAYHGRVDVPGEIAAARAEGLTMDVTLADVLGPLNGHVPPLLLNALETRLREAADFEPETSEPVHSEAVTSEPAHAGAAHFGAALKGSLPGRLDAVVLAAAGTRDAGAQATVDQAAAALEARLGVPCRVAYASAVPPLSGDAVTQLRAGGHTRIGLASYFLAPGLLYDATVESAREAGVVAVADPLTNTPDLVRLLATRIRTATARPAPAHAA